MLAVFMSYFVFHGAFFAVFSAQSYWFFEQDQYQFCFIVLILFYMKFVVQHILQLRNKVEMRRKGRWLRPRLYMKIIEHSLMAVSMVLVPFYIQEAPQVRIPGWLLLIPPSLAALINLFLTKYD